MTTNNTSITNTIRRFGNNIALLRERKNFSQFTLAEKLDVSVMTISRIENGHVVTNIKLLLQIAELFNISVESLLFDEL